MKPMPKQPGIYITKKKEVMLFVEKEMHGEAFDLPALRLGSSRRRGVQYAASGSSPADTPGCAVVGRRERFRELTRPQRMLCALGSHKARSCTAPLPI